ncbi:hypothetical protein K3759_12115 [Sulfitobacter sp. W027]|uniref:hypothetical protein n=1 Tax=Sulfitobacter sp. W027 TaxID=2867025 RepID=UPI0021A5CFD4|nr:hypothetical protein [Sulfitobacter sp. W027]UWR32686.1 hypothetical protein K3759_12115 [Sulfitobacter sp. W027]
MNKTVDSEPVLLAALDAKDFLRRHGNSLTELLDLVAGVEGVDAYCTADRLLDRLNPDTLRVGKALREMRDLLAEADALNGQFGASLRWHGARLNDLATRLPG